MRFGAFIRQHRNARGLTLLDVAAEIDVSVPYLSKIERDRENPPRDEIIRRLARVLSIPEDEAFAAASRLPPDLQGRASEVFALYRRFSR
jgi:HTH-type transcriptional regulator, competence development regulator